jgi:ABC-type nitrate/sulfonate/bicarbonate transport system substrate-binding protein
VRPRHAWLVLVSILLILACLLPLGARPAPAQAQVAPIPIRIGYQAVASWLLFGARSLKLFEKAGLTPTYLKFTAGAPMIAAAQSKSVDVSMVGTVPFLAGISQGVDWVFVGLDNEYPRAEGFVARQGSGVTTLADLKGKTIGFFRGSTSHYAVLSTLKRFGIERDQVKLLHLEPAQQLAAMMNKQIDVAAVWEPWMQKMIHQADGKIVAVEADLGLYTGLGGYAVRRDWLGANREAVRRFLTALLMAYDALEKDPAVALKAVADEMGIPEAWSMAIYREEPLPGIYRQADPTYQYSLATGSPFRASFADLARFLVEEHVITREVDTPRALDDSVLAEVIAARKKAAR